MRPSLPLAALLIALVAPAAFGQSELRIDGRTSAVLLFPADSVFITIQGDDSAHVAVRLGPDRGPDLYPGDLITALNGHAVTSGSEVKKHYDALEPGDDVRLSVERAGVAHEVAFPKPERPSGQLAIRPTSEQIAELKSTQGWSGDALATAEAAAQWVVTPGATATHDPVNGTVRFEGAQDAALRFDAEPPIDLSVQEALRVRFKGDGGTYALRLTDADGQSARLPFDTKADRWAVEVLPLGGLDLDLATVTRMEIVPESAPFRLELDAIEPR